MNITLGFINQTNETESRVGITPDVAKRLLKVFKPVGEATLEIKIEARGGEKSYFYDADYSAIGVQIVSRSEALQCDFVGFITTPAEADISGMKNGATAIGLFNSLSDQAVAGKFEAKGVQAIDMNLLPRQLSMAQSMDAMTSQASVAGYKAVLKAANEYANFFPMLTTAAGTIKPAAVLILGAGIAGLQAIGTAKRLGAVVTAFDVRPAAKEEVQSLGAKFLDLGKYGAADVAKVLEDIAKGQGDGGYARALTPEELQAQKVATDAALTDFDIVITTAQVPGKTPPQFISQAGVNKMKAGSVIVDLAASELGGNVEGSQPNKTVMQNGVKIIGAPYLASQAAISSSNLLARNITDVFQYFAGEQVNEQKELYNMVISGNKENITVEETRETEQVIPKMTETAISSEISSEIKSEEETNKEL